MASFFLNFGVCVFPYVVRTQFLKTATTTEPENTTRLNNRLRLCVHNRLRLCIHDWLGLRVHNRLRLCVHDRLDRRFASAVINRLHLTVLAHALSDGAAVAIKQVHTYSDDNQEKNSSDGVRLFFLLCRRRGRRCDSGFTDLSRETTERPHVSFFFSHANLFVVNGYRTHT
jgi:hypothetical protein